jgi:hypothetical protein
MRISFSRESAVTEIAPVVMGEGAGNQCTPRKFRNAQDTRQSIGFRRCDRANLEEESAGKLWKMRVGRGKQDDGDRNIDMMMKGVVGDVIPKSHLAENSTRMGCAVQMSAGAAGQLGQGHFEGAAGWQTPFALLLRGR